MSVSFQLCLPSPGLKKCISNFPEQYFVPQHQLWKVTKPFTFFSCWVFLFSLREKREGWRAVKHGNRLGNRTLSGHSME